MDSAHRRRPGGQRVQGSLDQLRRTTLRTACLAGALLLSAGHAAAEPIVDDLAAVVLAAQQDPHAAPPATQSAQNAGTAPATAPGSNEPSSRSASQPIPQQERRALGNGTGPLEGRLLSQGDPAARPTLTGHWMVRTIVALGAVIGLALMLRMLCRAVAGNAGSLSAQIGAGGRAPSGVLMVLGRYPIARGQTLVLMQLDRRVLLLNQTPAGFSTLTEIADSEEVASIIRKCEAGSRSRSNDDDSFDAIIRSMERDPEVATGRLDGRAAYQAAAPTPAACDPVSKAQSLLDAARRKGLVGLGRGA
jgi:hypothetical protein